MFVRDQMIICIRDGWNAHHPILGLVNFIDPRVPVVGKVYTVDKMYSMWDNEYVILQEVQDCTLLTSIGPVTGDRPWGWQASYFRPLTEQKKETDITVFNKLLKTKEKVLEDV